MRRRLIVVVLTVAAALAALASAPAQARMLAEPAVSTIASGIDVPWAVAFLPDGTPLITERDTAKILTVDNGKPKVLQHVDGVDIGRQAGLLGIAVSPLFRFNHLVFVYYSTPTDFRIGRLVLGAQQTPTVIVSGIPRGVVRNGGRLAFGPDGYLYAGTGDALDYDHPQDLGSLGGKILRMTENGKPAPGNPFHDSLVYAYGFRDVQGLAWDGDQLYASDIGEHTWDEVNRVDSGGNYGWPICEGACGKPEYHDPLTQWHPADACPSGIAVWQGALYVTAMRGVRLWKLPLSGDGQSEALFTGEYGRLRDAVVAPDGALWITTSNRDHEQVGAKDDQSNDYVYAITQ